MNHNMSRLEQDTLLNQRNKKGLLNRIDRIGYDNINENNNNNNNNSNDDNNYDNNYDNNNDNFSLSGSKLKMKKGEITWKRYGN